MVNSFASTKSTSLSPLSDWRLHTTSKRLAGLLFSAPKANLESGKGYTLFLFRTRSVDPFQAYFTLEFLLAEISIDVQNSWVLFFFEEQALPLSNSAQRE